MLIGWMYEGDGRPWSKTSKCFAAIIAILWVIFFILLIIYIHGCAPSEENPIVKYATWFYEEEPELSGQTHWYAKFLQAENEDQSFREIFVFNGATWFVSGGVQAFRDWWYEEHPEKELPLGAGAMCVTYKNGDSELWVNGKIVNGLIWLDPQILFHEIMHQFQMRWPDMVADPHDWYESPPF